jgi:hypothetical protein
MTQSADEAARPARFTAHYDQVGLAHRHRPRALSVGGAPRDEDDGADDGDECDTHMLPEMAHLEHLRLHAPVHDTAVSALLASLVRLKTLEIGRSCQTGGSLDFSALQALESLDLDEDHLRLRTAKTLPASLRSLSARIGYHGSHAPVDLCPYLRNLTALRLPRLEPECEPCVAAILAHMPRLVDLTLHLMSDFEARVFAKLQTLEALGTIAGRQLLAFTVLRQLRRLTAIGNVVAYSVPVPPDVFPPPSSVWPPSSSPVLSATAVAFSILCRLPALERLDLSGLVVHCRSAQSAADEKLKFEADARMSFRRDCRARVASCVNLVSMTFVHTHTHTHTHTRGCNGKNSSDMWQHNNQYEINFHTHTHTQTHTQTHKHERAKNV